MKQIESTTTKDSLKSMLALAIDEVMQDTTEKSAMLLEAVQEQVDLLTESIKAVSAPVMTVRLPDLKEVKLEKPAASILPKLLSLASARMPALIQGPAGSGKTTAAQQVAEVLGLPFYCFVMSEDMGKGDLFGRQTSNGFTESIIVKAVKHGGVLLLDEADTAMPGVLLALNSLRSGHGIKGRSLYNSTTGETIDAHPDFILFLACNTFGRGADRVYTGRQRLDGAFLNGFILVKYSYSDEIEKAIASSYGRDGMALLSKLQKARKSLKRLGSDEIISTRNIQQACELRFSLDWPESEVIEALTMAWPDGLADQVFDSDEKDESKAG